MLSLPKHLSLCRFFSTGIVLLLVSGAARAETKITYADQVLPIFRNACLNCHNPDKAKSGLDLSTYGATMKGSDGGAVVNPGDAMQSLLFRVITHAEEPRMPQKSDKLPDSELALIKEWINAGAPESASSPIAAKKPSQPAVLIAPEEKPTGPPAMPRDLLLEPVVQTKTPSAITAMAASRWAPLVAIGGEKQVALYHTETLDLLGVLPFPEGTPATLKFSRNGALLLAGGGVGAKSGRVVAWDVVTGERSFEVGEEFDTVLAADLSPDQSRVVLGGPSKKLKIYSTNGQLVKSIKKHTDWVTAVAFSPDGKLFASGDRQGNLYVWEADGAELFSLAGHKGAITALAAAGQALVSASEDGTIRIWDLKEGKQVKSWNAHNGGVLAAAFTADGKIVSCGRDRVTRVWDQNGQQKLACEAFTDVALQAAGSGDRIIAGDWTGLIRVWAADGKRLGELSPNPPPIVERLVAAERQLTEAMGVNDRSQAALARAQQTSVQFAAEASRHAADIAKSEARREAIERNLPTLSKAVAEAETAENKTREEYAQLSGKAETLSAQAVEVQATGSAQADALRQIENAKAEAETAMQTTSGILSNRANAAEKARTDLSAARRELETVKTALADLRQTLPAKSAAEKAANEVLETARKEAARTAQQLDLAKAGLAHWRAAELNVTLHAARRDMNAREKEFNASTEAARVASSELDKAKADLTGAEKSLAEAPNRIKAREADIAKARAELQKRQGAIDAAKKLMADRESLEKSAADFSAKLQTEAIASTADALLAEAAGKAKEAADLVASSGTKAREAVVARTEEFKQGGQRLASAEAALGQTQREAADGPALISRLRTAAKEAAARTAPARSVADVAVESARKPLAEAKKKVDDLAVKYRALSEEAQGPITVVSRTE